MRPLWPLLLFILSVSACGEVAPGGAGGGGGTYGPGDPRGPMPQPGDTKPSPGPGDTASVPGVSHFPTGTLAKLQQLTGLDALQLTNILGMIQGPEQGRPEWWLDADGGPIWGYAEDIGDGRGVTIGLYGATTGVGYSDADVLWKAYGRDLGQGTPAQIIANVHAVQDDPNWHAAMFDAYITTYWQPAEALLQPLGYRSALTFGALLDTAMNAGMDDDSSRHWGATHLVRVSAAGAPNEGVFLDRFLSARQQYPTANSGNMRARIRAWQRLLADRQWDMRAKGLLKRYIYIP
jgi:chitosanase